MTKFDRSQVLINLLQSRPGIKAPELAKETGVCERTIYRDMLWLESQYPVIHNNGYSLDSSLHLKPLAFTKAEYNVLHLALSTPALQRPDLKKVTCSLKAKIDTVVNPNVRNCSSKINQFAPVLIESCSDTQRMATLSGILQQAMPVAEP
jgi:predicted DNA-binding transcriptional regulator YafY